jgi:hypothetical protein
VTGNSHGQDPFTPVKGLMHLEQGQVWHKGEEYFRIVTWERLAIEYKVMKNLDSKEGTLHQVTKKEFCRLLKGAVLHPTDQPNPTPPAEITASTDKAP